MKIQVTVEINDEEHRALVRIIDWGQQTTTESGIRFVIHAVWRKFITDLVASSATEEGIQ